ncbi:AtpZ/AtpI family protein [Segnochrobactraceae bacterium EtOH-i3]
MTDTPPPDRLEGAARTAAERERDGRKVPEPSLGSRLGQIGILGWTIVVPVLLGTFLGRQLDLWLGTGIQFAAAFILLGAAFGLWSAWRWMHRS